MNALAPLNAVPLVTLQVKDKWATWNGKWHLNVSIHVVEAMGGPWETEQDAVNAVLATGLFRLLPDRKTPHFVRR